MDIPLLHDRDHLAQGCDQGLLEQNYSALMRTGCPLQEAAQHPAISPAWKQRSLAACDERMGTITKRNLANSKLGRNKTEIASSTCVLIDRNRNAVPKDPAPRRL